MTQGLIATDLRKKYRSRYVVDSVCLEVLPGEIVGLLGPNGAGKTTLFYMMIGLIKPDSGSVIFNGQDITNHPIHERSRLGLGYLAQEPSVFKDLSVADNIQTVLEIVETNASSIPSRKADLLQEFGLTRCASQKAGMLSGGERRRLEVARTLATRPKYVMLDEPFANVDPIAIAGLKELICLLKAKSIGILITDHNARELMSIADRGYLLADGQVLRSGTSLELTSDEQARACYFGENFST